MSSRKPPFRKKPKLTAKLIEFARASGGDPILNKDQVAALVGVHISTLDRMRRDPALQFPRPKRLSARRIGWLLSDVVAWMKGRPLA